MKLKLPSGAQVELKCKHSECGPPRPELPSGVYHRTDMAILFPDGRKLEGHTTCAPSDVFCKTTGRRKALDRLITTDRIRNTGARLLTGQDIEWLARTLCQHIFRPTVRPKVARQAIAVLRAINEMATAMLTKEPPDAVDVPLATWLIDQTGPVLTKMSRKQKQR